MQLKNWIRLFCRLAPTLHILQVAAASSSQRHRFSIQPRLHQARLDTHEFASVPLPHTVDQFEAEVPSYGGEVSVFGRFKPTGGDISGGAVGSTDMDKYDKNFQPPAEQPMDGQSWRRYRASLACGALVTAQIASRPSRLGAACSRTLLPQ